MSGTYQGIAWDIAIYVQETKCRGGALSISIYYAQGRFMSHTAPLVVEEHVHGETIWVALRSRGADWSWLTPDEAVQLGREWIEKYAAVPQAAE
jgi:hypothetical protein